MAEHRIVLLARDTGTARMFYHAVSHSFNIEKVIFENRESNWKMIQRRVKKLGWQRVLGQLAFQVLIVPALKLFSQQRINQIVASNNLNCSKIPVDKIIYVNSANDKSCADHLKRLRPEIIIVHGTRILTRDLLNTFPGRFINMHAGITPLYRGVHGMYWALVNNDEQNAGVTIHLVDSGIDTGRVLSSGKVTATEADNFVTYPYLQIAAGLPLLIKSIGTIKNTLDSDPNQQKGRLWYHPTLWQYLSGRLSGKAK